MSTPENATETVERLRKQIRTLEDQVKKLLAGEVNQYHLQARLDLERKTQADLLALSEKLHRSRNQGEIAGVVAEALVESFEFERSVFCGVTGASGEVTVLGLEGYYEPEAVASVKDLVPGIMARPEFRSDAVRIFRSGASPVPGMYECVILPCLSGVREVTAFVIFGTSEGGSAFFRRIDQEDRYLWESIGRVTSIALENARLYNQLARERGSLRIARDNLRRLNEHLEGIVEERTKGLRESEAEYRKLYTDSDRMSTLYRALLDASPDPIVVYDIEGCPTYLNPAFTRVFGWTFDELEGRAIDFVPPETRSETQKMINLVLRGQGFSNRETKRLTKDGRIIDVSISGSIFFDEEGKAAGSVVHLRDITERKIMEEELLKVRKLESVGLLAGGIAHDFNNIMATILMNAQLAQQSTRVDDSTLRYLSGIREATERATALTQQLLTFSKGGAPVMRTASIADLIRSSVSFILRGSNVRSEFFLPDDLWPVEVDEGQMNQVIQNLIMNADEAMPDGGLIRVSAENVADAERTANPNLQLNPGRHVKISIRDTGSGIPEEHLPRIFDPYFTTKEKGSGLGLSITFSIIAKHRGVITVESEVGSGAAFHFYLPSVEQPAADSNEGPRAGKPSPRRGRILLMDDEETIAGLAAELLENMGYEVEIAFDGAQALDLYENSMKGGQPFDLVIMDLTVPGGMGGKETIRILKRIDPAVKAVVSSGYANDPIMADFKAYGFRGVVTKPYGAEQLIDEISRVLETDTEHADDPAGVEPDS
jgi:PAS domain S-box-containing protein